MSEAKVRTNPTCRMCGSHNVVRDATAVWDTRRQTWIMSDDICDSATCGDCDKDMKWCETTNEPPPGTVISGTLRMQDLLPAFLAALRNINSVRAECVEADIVPRLDQYAPDDAWWDGEDAQWALDELVGFLGAEAPLHHYFGAHPGDGSDFGFWPYKD